MSSPSLRELQQRMKARIHPASQAPQAPAAPLPLNPQRGTPGEARLAVYADGYLARIREALAEVYEAVHHVLGDEAFTALAEAYAARHPSHEYNLSFSGRSLPAFLAAWPLTKDLPFLPDLAALEWRVCEAFHAFDAPPVDVGGLARVPAQDWERLRLVVQPSAAVVDSPWPILELWSARRQPRHEVDIPLLGRPQCVLVFRQQDRVRCELIDQPQRRLLAALQAGRTLGEACAEVAAASPPEAGTTPLGVVADGSAADRRSRPTEPGTPPLAQWFAAWGRAGLITRIDAP